MKALIGLFTAFLFASSVMADGVAVSSAHHSVTWIVIGDKVYFCTVVQEPASVENPICFKADMKD